MSADKWCARTDLALETQESLKKANTDMRGVNFSEKKLDNGIIVSVVTIDSENAVRATGRPKGKYVTIEAAMLSEGDEERDVSSWLGNPMQREAFNKLYSVADRVRIANDPRINQDWDYLQASNNFRQMTTKPSPAI